MSIKTQTKAFTGRSTGLAGPVNQSVTVYGHAIIDNHAFRLHELGKKVNHEWCLSLGLAVDDNLSVVCAPPDKGCELEAVDVPG
ncbi:MAG: hypothetical protein ACXWPX_10950 [Pseudobdellovibrio sp.]